MKTYPWLFLYCSWLFHETVCPFHVGSIPEPLGMNSVLTYYQPAVGNIGIAAVGNIGLCQPAVGNIGLSMSFWMCYRNLAYRISRSTGLMFLYYHTSGTNNSLPVSFRHVSKHRNHCSWKTALRGSPGQLRNLPNNNFVRSTSSLRTKPERKRFVSGWCWCDSSRCQHPLTYRRYIKELSQ